MKKTLIFYNPEYSDLAIKLCDNYRAHDHEEADIVSSDEHDDIEYARKMQYAVKKVVGILERLLAFKRDA